MSARIDERVAEARSHISVLTVAQAKVLHGGGALFVDTRPTAQRERFGTIRGAVAVERNVLEWRLDPTSEHRHPAVAAHAGPIVVFCQEGYASSLAVESLQRLGVTGVHDLSGGFAAWSAAGFPTESASTQPSPPPPSPTPAPTPNERVSS